jgi:glyoxylase-like metal-dependent hydrolase (beta-lactamase superfamily II)
MKTTTFVKLVVIVWIASLWCEAQVSQPAFRLDVQKVADGVYVAAHTELPGLLPDANSVFIINDDDVVVVDTNLTLESARASLAELRKLTDKPVRFVINTHWHDDHVTGNQVYREAFPQAEFIAHEETREALLTESLENRRRMQEGAPGFVEQMKAAMANGQSIVGKEISAAERESYKGDFARVEQYLGDTPKLNRVLPAVTLTDGLTLYRGQRKIEVRYMGRGHSRGEVVVYLPGEKVLVAGDLVSPTEPLIGDKSHVGEWIDTLEKLRSIRAEVIVPGHGAVMRDGSKVILLHDLLLSIKQQTDASAAKGESLEQVRKGIDLEKYRKAFAGEDPLLNALFSFYVQGPGVAKAFKEASEKR